VIVRRPSGRYRSRRCVITLRSLVLVPILATPLGCGPPSGPPSDGVSASTANGSSTGTDHTSSDGDTHAPCDPVQFADENLERAVREQLRIPDGPISAAGIVSLETLGVEDPVDSFEGLQCASQLRGLHVHSGAVEDLSPLVTLDKLEGLGVTGSLVDISPLKHLHALRGLSLVGNRIVDISALENLTELDSLNLRDNQIMDVAPLANLSELRRLDLSENAIVDITALSTLKNVDTLEIDDNQVDDISAIVQMDGLRALYARRNRIANVSPLRDLTAPTMVIWLDGNSISDLDGLLGGAWEEADPLCGDLLMFGNPLTEHAIAKSLPEVCERLGVAIWWGTGECGGRSCISP
jgi:Leucine-rich repeat (LRR) protein